MSWLPLHLLEPPQARGDRLLHRGGQVPQFGSQRGHLLGLLARLDQHRLEGRHELRILRLLHRDRGQHVPQHRVGARLIGEHVLEGLDDVIRLRINVADRIADRLQRDVRRHCEHPPSSPAGINVPRFARPGKTGPKGPLVLCLDRPSQGLLCWAGTCHFHGHRTAFDGNRMAIERLTRSPLKWQSNGTVEALWKAREVARKPKGELTRKLAARAYEGHGTLYRWTREHFAELRSARAAYKPTWQAIADLAAEAGQVDRANKPPSAAAM